MATYTLDIDDPEKSRLVRLLLKQWGYEEISRNHFINKDSPRAKALATVKKPTPVKKKVARKPKPSKPSKP